MDPKGKHADELSAEASSITDSKDIMHRITSSQEAEVALTWRRVCRRRQ